jgi:hypothetical protein
MKPLDLDIFWGWEDQWKICPIISQWVHPAIHGSSKTEITHITMEKYLERSLNANQHGKG